MENLMNKGFEALEQRSMEIMSSSRHCFEVETVVIESVTPTCTSKNGQVTKMGFTYHLENGAEINSSFCTFGVKDTSKVYQPMMSFKEAAFILQLQENENIISAYLEAGRGDREYFKGEVNYFFTKFPKYSRAYEDAVGEKHEARITYDTAVAFFLDKKEAEKAATNANIAFEKELAYIKKHNPDVR